MASALVNRILALLVVGMVFAGAQHATPNDAKIGNVVTRTSTAAIVANARQLASASTTGATPTASVTAAELTQGTGPCPGRVHPGVSVVHNDNLVSGIKPHASHGSICVQALRIGV
jgi:hypothetical protein